MRVWISNCAKAIGTLWHATNGTALQYILRDNEFALSSKFGREAEKLHGDQKYDFFLSTTRSIRGYFHSRFEQSILIELDGTRLSDRYKIVPVDYWGHGGTDQGNEMEERVLSKKNKIPNALSYIKRVVFVLGSPKVASYIKMFEPDAKPTEKEIDTFYKDNSSLRGALKSVRICRTNNIPVEFYATLNDIIAHKPIKIGAEYLGKNEFSRRHSRVEQQDLDDVLSLINGNPTPRASKQWDRYDGYPRDKLSYINTFLHNAAKPGALSDSFAKLLRILRRLGLNGANEIVAHIDSKMRDKS